MRFQRNNTNINSTTEKEFVPPEECLLPLDEGSKGRGFFQLFYYDAEAKECKRFIKRSAKGGNANQFITKNVRRTLLLQFCCGLADRYLEDKQLQESAPTEKPVEEVVQNITQLHVDEMVRAQMDKSTKK